LRQHDVTGRTQTRVTFPNPAGCGFRDLVSKDAADEQHFPNLFQRPRTYTVRERSPTTNQNPRQGLAQVQAIRFVS